MHKVIQPAIIIHYSKSVDTIPGANKLEYPLLFSMVGVHLQF